MVSVNKALHEEAESIFTDLGYAVTASGGELLAERKWRMVQVTPMSEPGDPPTSGEMRCFVTWEECVSGLERRLARTDPDYEWAIIGIGDEDYVVSRRSSV